MLFLLRADAATCCCDQCHGAHCHVRGGVQVTTAPHLLSHQADKKLKFEVVQVVVLGLSVSSAGQAWLFQAFYQA